MGKGSIGNLASAATVAASSFDMRVKNARTLLDLVDRENYLKMCNVWGLIAEEGNEVSISKSPLSISEPDPSQYSELMDKEAFTPPQPISDTITGRVQRFGDHVDTDAIIPAEFMPGVSDEDLGTHCFQYVRPEFREKVNRGYTIVVAGKS
jgi:homoaconitate hydratase